MLLIGLISLLLAIPISSTITPVYFTRITSIILLFSAALSLNSLYIEIIGSGLGLYSGLFHVTNVTQFMELFLYIMGAFILLLNKSKRNEKADEKDEEDEEDEAIAEYPLIIVFTTIGASFLISSADLISMYLSIELQSFAVYVLATIYRNSESATSAGLKYFLLGALSSTLILLGSSLIYAYTGLTNFEGINLLTLNNLSILGVFIIGIGFLFKVAAAPFHN
jgi:NADH-ubiquinone oxidoreductase chain 2